MKKETRYLELKYCNCGWYSKPLSFYEHGQLYYRICPECGSKTKDRIGKITYDNHWWRGNENVKVIWK